MKRYKLVKSNRNIKQSGAGCPCSGQGSRGIGLPTDDYQNGSGCGCQGNRGSGGPVDDYQHGSGCPCSGGPVDDYQHGSGCGCRGSRGQDDDYNKTRNNILKLFNL